MLQPCAVRPHSKDDILSLYIFRMPQFTDILTRSESQMNTH